MHPVQLASRGKLWSAVETLLLSKFADETTAILSAYRKWVHPDARSGNLILACQPRGGSTWLAETLRALPDYEMIWEPFNPQWNPSCIEAGFTWHNYISDGGLTSPQSSFVEELLNGFKVYLGHFGGNGSLGCITSMAYNRHLIFKCTNACMMVSNLRDVVPLKTVMLLRHPCAVVASQLSHGSWKGVNKENPSVKRDVEKVLEDYPDWRPIWNEISTQEEVLAFIWGMRTHVPLRQPDRAEWCITTYESLVRDRTDELKRIFEYLERPMVDQVTNKLDSPSSTTQSDSNVAEGRDPLKTWKHRLDREQVRRVLTVTRQMGIEFYTEELTPHERRLSAWISSTPKAP